MFVRMHSGASMICVCGHSDSTYYRLASYRLANYMI